MSEKNAKKVEEYIRKYSSVRNWLRGKKRYTPKTEKQYIEYLELWCKLSGKNPDELANCEDIDKMRAIIAVGLRLHLSIRSVIYRLHPLNSFWRANGRQISDTYGGIKGPLRRDIKRSRKWRPTRS